MYPDKRTRYIFIGYFFFNFLLGLVVLLPESYDPLMHFVGLVMIISGVFEVIRGLLWIEIIFGKLAATHCQERTDKMYNFGPVYIYRVTKEVS